MKTVQMDIYRGQFLPWHRVVVEDKHRFKTIVAGRKARKTTLIVNELMYHAMTDPRGLVYPYFAPYRKQGKSIVWDDHVGTLLRTFAEYGIKYKVNNSELTVKFEGGSTFQVEGADNAEAQRGKSNWGGVGIDECATIRPYVWQEVIRPNLQVHRAWCYFGGTPKGFGNWFYELSKLGDHDKVIDSTEKPTDKDFMSWRFTSYDNPFNDVEELESAKRTTTLDFFNQEYLALFTRFTGLVFKEFDLSTHVEDFEHTYNDHGDYYFGLDFAVRGFTACLVGFVKTDGHIYILDEYKEEGEAAKNHAVKIKEMIRKYGNQEKYSGYADPAGWAKNQQSRETDMIWSIADEYLEEDLPIVRANNEVTAGINFVRQLFINGKIHINPRCEKLIDEILQYQWREQTERKKGAESEPEKVRKVNDHLVDCLRYLCYSKPLAAEATEDPRPPMAVKFELKLEEEDPNKDSLEEIEIPSIYD